MTILETYRKVLSGGVSQKLFLETVRKNKTCAQWINPLLSYEDTVRILKNKSILTEEKNPAIDFSALHNAEETEVEPECFPGLGNDSGHVDNLVHVREDQEGYHEALQDIKNQLEDMEQGKDGGPTAVDVDQLIVNAKLEYGLTDADMDALKQTLTDWRSEQYGKTTTIGGNGLYENIMSAQDANETVSNYLLKNGYNKEKTASALSKLCKGDEPVYRAFTSITIAPDFVKNAVQYLYSNGKKQSLNEVKRKLTADLANYNEYDKGWKYEFTNSKVHNRESLEKAKKKALANLTKNPNYYTFAMNGIDPNKKEKRTDQMTFVQKNNVIDKDNGMKEVKGFGNAKASANKAKKEKPKAKKVKEMTQTPKRAKGIKAVMEVPGKEKKMKLKEAIARLVQEVMKEEKSPVQKKTLK